MGDFVKLKNMGQIIALDWKSLPDKHRNGPQIADDPYLKDNGTAKLICYGCLILRCSVVLSFCACKAIISFAENWDLKTGEVNYVELLEPCHTEAVRVYNKRTSRL